ncbi:MAG: hypothetical protein CMC71_01505 [Flavobacteriaceae bacterium]|nr:hypothetical protein [Flavobacteriaceae bacterium]
MRQGGMKPKSHSSGVYWVRANANSGGGRKSESSEGEAQEGGMAGGITVFLAIVTIISAYFIA